MHSKPNRELIAEKLARQERPDSEGTLKRCECEIGNLLDSDVLDSDWREIFTDLRRQVSLAI